MLNTNHLDIKQWACKYNKSQGHQDKPLAKTKAKKILQQSTTVLLNEM